MSNRDEIIPSLVTEQCAFSYVKYYHANGNEVGEVYIQWDPNQNDIWLGRFDYERDIASEGSPTKITFAFDGTDSSLTYNEVLEILVEERTSGEYSMTVGAHLEHQTIGKTRVTVWVTDQCTPDVDGLTMNYPTHLDIPWGAQSVTQIDWSGDERLGTGDCPFDLTFLL